MINWSILKQPWNWFLVAFTLVLVVSIAHLFLRNSPNAE